MSGDDSLQSLVDELSAAIGRPVVLDDAGLVPLAYSRQWGHLDPVRRKSILGRGAPEKVREALFAQGIREVRGWMRTEPNAKLGMEGRVCFPIRARGEVAGYLWLLDPDASLSEPDLRTTRVAARRIASVLGGLSRILPADENLLLDGLRSPSPDERERAVAQVLERQLLPDAPVLLCIVASGVQQRDIAAMVRSASRRLSIGHAITGGGPHRSELLASLSDPVLRGGRPDELAALLSSEAGADVSVGQSAPSALNRLHEANRQAGLALRVAQSGSTGSRAAAWPTLGADRLTAQLGPSVLDDLPDRVQYLLRDEPTLVETLAVFLDAAGDVKAATTALSLHRSGLYHRLRRIEELTGLNLHSGDDRLLAHIAVRAKRMA